MFHAPVLLSEVLFYLHPKPQDTVIDATLGGGGHFTEIAKRVLPEGKVIGIDRDEDAMRETRLQLKLQQPKSEQNVILVKDNFRNILTIAKENELSGAEGILFDIGVSSYQLDAAERGFGFASNRLDMRMDKEQTLTASHIVNTWKEQNLVQIFQVFGEERKAREIAKKIVQARKVKKITHPDELEAIVAEVYRRAYRKPSLKNPATKVFQALRIAVNDELENVRIGLEDALTILRRGGRICVITYHSLEDRIVKELFLKESRDCICPPERPVCQCGHMATISIITKKPIIPSPEETERNPRSRSAKMRVAEKL